LVQDKYSSQGADGYDPIPLFKAQLLIYLGEVKSDRKLAAALRYDARLCLLCGFNFLKTPSNGTFTNFRDRLGEDTFYEILHRLIAQAITLQVITGHDTAVDSTHLWAYANQFGRKACSCKGKCHCHREYSDPDAAWGHKTKEYAFFGYKVHLIVAKPLIQRASEKHPELDMQSIAMDAGYDAYENYRFVADDMKAAPIIALNPRNGEDALVSGDLHLSSDGKYTCLAGFPVVYWGKDSKRDRLKFRCPAALGKCQCLFQSVCSPSSYGRTFYLHPDRDYRLIGPIPRGTAKGSHRMGALRVRGLAKVAIHVCMALCAQIVKRIGSTITDRLDKLDHSLCRAEA